MRSKLILFFGLDKIPFALSVYGHIVLDILLHGWPIKTQKPCCLDVSINGDPGIILECVL
jgi:hypothetical protein